MLISPLRTPSRTFFTSLSQKECAIALRACLLIYSYTRGKMVPHRGQLESTVASDCGRDSSVIARTGLGKTLCITIPLLLKPGTITLTVYPLKRLQAMQVKDFWTKYGIPTVGINEDTSDSPELWKKIENGEIPHLIVQPEQFRLTNGHLPRMAKLLRVRSFTSKVSRVAIDEAHNIYTAGTIINGRPPFRPAWGALGELRVWLPKNTCYQALSATIPDYILRIIRQNLAFSSDAVTIRVSINRPNIIYATQRLVDGRNNMKNVDCIIPQPFHPPMRLPRLVVFHGEKAETCNYSQYLNARLPPALQNLGICAHYHSDMSPEYLEQTYNSFANPDGTGLDVPEIDGVINIGLPEGVPKRFQFEGRAGRSSTRDAFALTMIEPWVFEMDLDGVIDDKDDPDRPLLTDGLKKKNPKAYAEFFGDDSDEGKLRPQFMGTYLAGTLALNFTCRWCCDGHPSNGFSLSELFLGPIYEGEDVRTATKRKRNKYRPVKQRPKLVELLTEWVTEVHQKDELRFVRPPSFILDDTGIKELSRANSPIISSFKSVTYLLRQSEEWETLYAQALFELIKSYDGTLPVKRRKKEVVESDEEDQETDEEPEPPFKRVEL
ncbi:P-loop containing nucleoside triphosphate hydrolase protein [Mycena maculata]|uniref:DNA 3'-5' helicase n=1 Tax=Mycena maculata TaxID=230809 RepID=A0AAD7HMS1_9AGAR|nr:P-loop containing nucleoside triphosphate hydrolase protein [Mycena maculata]